MSADFNTFAEQVRAQRGVEPFSGRLLALDPGETTGWSVWNCEPGQIDRLSDQGQLATWDKEHTFNPEHELALFVNNFTWLLHRYKPTRVVFESYHVYDWKLDTHSWSDVPTLRIIGGIESLLLLQAIPYSSQTAQVAKRFVTDEMLKSFGFYQRGLRHSRDSMRHGIYYLCFGPTK